MSLEVASYILLFFTTAFLGWLMEVICKLIQFRRFINRGFLLGPICPIYGFGSVLITLLLERYAQDPLTVFIMAMVVCGTLEYITSYLMEKLFHARWWDYSGKRFNLNGRVCADTLIPFGLLGLGLIYLVKPFLFGLYAAIPETLRNGLCYGLIAVFVADTAISGKVMTKIRSTATKAVGDSTEAITRAVHAMIAKQSPLARRLLHAYPQVRLSNTKLLKRLKEESESLRRSANEKREKFRIELAQKEAELQAENRRIKQELAEKKRQLRLQNKKRKNIRRNKDGRPAPEEHSEFLHYCAH